MQDVLGGPPAGVEASGRGPAAFGAVFSLNSAVKSYLILDYAGGGKIALNVGFYHMANAGGLLMGRVRVCGGRGGGVKVAP